MISSDDLFFFGAVASSASLADAARKLNVSPPAVTQRLRTLEHRAGVRLIDRSSKGIRLTDEGELVAAQGGAIVASIEQLQERLGQRSTAVRGRLRVVAPHGFGRKHVAPVVGEFVQLHPEASVTLELSDNPASLSSESWDVVIHIGGLNSPARLVTTLAPNHRIICASPSYLQSHPEIIEPEDLRGHNCLTLRENDEDVTLWRFTHISHGSSTVRIRPAMSTNDGAVMRSWALDGLGVIIRSEWDLADDLANGRLVRVLTNWRCPDADVLALLNPQHGRSRRTTVILELLRRRLHPVPWRMNSP